MILKLFGSQEGVLRSKKGNILSAITKILFTYIKVKPNLKHTANSKFALVPWNKQLESNYRLRMFSIQLSTIPGKPCSGGGGR